MKRPVSVNGRWPVEKILKNDCKITAWLEAVLMMAAGARVMLYHNIDTKVGLVNGALRTVVSLTGWYIRVRFCHINEPYDGERQIILLNKLLHLSTAISADFSFCHHNTCQGLSLTSAFVDLSDSIFCFGKALYCIVTSWDNVQFAIWSSSYQGQRGQP